MALEKIAASKAIAARDAHPHRGQSFKDVLNKKRTTIGFKPPTPLATALSNVMKNQELASKSLKEILSKGTYAPDKLIRIQYTTGVYFLKQQMFCKTAELSANTLKNFTQMQI